MRRLILLVGVALSLAACDFGPSGPGDLTGFVETPGPVLGGAVLEVVGKGITSFSGSGGTEVFFVPTDAEATYRVVLLAQTPGQLQFRVAVQDRAAKKPTVSVVGLVSGGNLPLPATADYGVRFSRR